MKPKYLRRVAVASLLVVAAAGAAGTAAQANGGYAPGRTIRLVEAHTTAQPKFVDVDGDKATSLGDLAIVKDGLNREDGTPAGDFVQVCTLVTLGPAQPLPLTSGYECTGTIHLANGTITQQGSFTPTLPDQLDAISGGTGAYQAARGEIETQAEADRITIRLR
jgi:hypothetical protein